MEIIIAKHAGFCGGVDFAITQAKELLKKEPIYCLGEIVHNEQVIKELEQNGMITVNSIDEIPEYSNVIFRAHGEPISTYQKAEERKLKIQDLTCANVKRIHQKVQEHKKDAFILIVGTKIHPEVIGTYGFSGRNVSVIESEEDILDAYIKYEKTLLEKVFVVAQTTFSSRKFDELADEIRKNFCEAEVFIEKTICKSTENRQLEAFKIALKSNIMLIIGSKNSSNTKKLFGVARENCKIVYAIETVEAIKDIKFNMNDKIGIIAGASTPNYIIDDVKRYLEGVC